MAEQAPAQNWRDLYIEREEELQWLMDAWQLVQEGKGPQMRIIHAESGYGKTRLCQRFYQELSTHHDPEGYWPDKLTLESKNLTVMPLQGAAKPSATIPWFWYGLRWPDEPEGRNLLQNHGGKIFNAVYDPDGPFLCHEENLLRTLNRKIHLRESAAKLSYIFAKNAVGLIPFGDFIKLTIDLAEDFLSLHQINQKEQISKQEQAQLESDKQREIQYVRKILASFAQLLSNKTSKGKEKPSLPVILLLDNAHSMSVRAMKILNALWQEAVAQGWPLLVVGTLWQREWNEGYAQEPWPKRKFSSWIKELLELNPEQAHRMEHQQLKGLPKMEQILQTAFPGLSQENQEYILQRVHGNPRHLEEVIRLLEDKQEWFEEEDRSKDLSEDGRLDLEDEGNLEIELLEQNRFKRCKEELKELLALSSLQGINFFKEFTVAVSQRIDGFAKNQESTELIDQADDPHALAEGINEQEMIFRSANLHAFAKELCGKKEKRYRQKLQQTDTPLGPIQEAFLEEGLARMNPEAWLKIPSDQRFAVLEFLYQQAQTALNATNTQSELAQRLHLWCLTRALYEIYESFGDWTLRPLWLERWEIAQVQLHAFSSPITENKQQSLLRARSSSDALLCHLQGIIFRFHRQTTEALQANEQSLKLVKITGKELDLGIYWHQKGMIFEEQRLWNQALDAYNEALRLKIIHSQENLLGATWNQKGNVYKTMRMWSQAIDAYDESLRQKQLYNQEYDSGGIWNNKGMVYQEQRLCEQALEAYDEAIRLNELHGQGHQLGSTWHQKGMVYEEQRSWQQALEAYDEAIRLKEIHGQGHQLGSTWHQKGTVYQKQRLWEHALEAYDEALRLKELHGQVHELGTTWHNKGIVYQEQRHWVQAIEAYEEALRLKELYGQGQQLGSTFAVLMLCYQAMAQEASKQEKANPQALDYFERSAEFALLAFQNFQEYQPHMLGVWMRDASSLAQKLPSEEGAQGQLKALLAQIQQMIAKQS